MNERGRWPGSARCCVCLTVDVDGESVDLNASPAGNLGGRFSHGRYGLQVGIGRLLEVLRAAEVRATFFVPAWDAEHWPAALEAILLDGHEIGTHGDRHEDHRRLGRAERSVLERAPSALFRLTGQGPVGWRAPGGMLSPNTLGHLARLGYLYDASFVDDDLPRRLESGDGISLIEVPQFPLLTDTPYYARYRPPESVLRVWAEEFDGIYEEGLLYTLKLHPRGDTGSGRALRARAVAGLLEHIGRHAGVWFATAREVADWWRQREAGMRAPLVPEARSA